MKLKQLIFRFILPLTVISFGTITKWWFTSVIDAPDTMYYGFPFPFVGNGWHTSMSLQIFIVELIADFLIYFLFWCAIVFSINKYLAKIKANKIVTIGLWVISGIIILGTSYFAGFTGHIFYFHRTYEIETIESGFKFIWQHIDQP